jgi:RHS repeat-associated protein
MTNEDRTLARNKGENATCYVPSSRVDRWATKRDYQNYHFDSRGSTVAMTDAKGVVADRFEYDSYGESLSHTGTSDTPFQFNGQYGVQTDRNGLLYMRARYYNPAIRRFINQDVLFGNINPGISLNRFAYANGNPISLMDPFGLCAQSDDARFNTDPLGYPTLEDWQVMFNDLTNLWNAYLAWTQGNRAWIEQNLPWLGNLIENLDEGSKYALIGEMSVEEGAVVDLLNLRERQLILGTDPERGFIQAEGMAGVRLEQALGRTISRGTSAAVDFVDSQLGPISLKGPIPAQGSVEGLANAVIRDAMGGNTATQTVVVDTLGLSEAQISSLKSAVEAGTQGTSKRIIYLH